MARQKGVMKYVGTIGDVRHFKIKGNQGYFAGMIGGPTGEQIATAPEFARTRENMNEFAGCAMVGKSLRVYLASLLKSMADNQVTGRLTAIMKKINLEDGSEARGQRAVLISAVPQYLDGFEFNRFVSFGGTITAPFTVTPTAGRDGSTVAFQPFNPLSFLNIPSGATHFRLVNAISAISDFQFNATTGGYEPKEPVLNELVDIKYSAFIPVNAVTPAITITSAFAGSPTLTSDVSVLNVIGIEFFQDVNGNKYLFSQGNCMKICKIF
jgi:hypothetical protein